MPVKHSMSEFKCTVQYVLGSSRHSRACTKQRFQQKKAAGQMRSRYICKLYMTQCVVRRQDAWARSVHAGKRQRALCGGGDLPFASFTDGRRCPQHDGTRGDLTCCTLLLLTRPSGLFRPTRLAASADGLGHTVGDYCGE
jgi:hypothetical protein